tara:strand:+ start:38665 stop:39060 length:396 start_codon:yes stop_codon:yes gene_type:complete
MELKANILFKKEMTSHILDNHDVKVYFSGREKKVGDKFILAVLLVPDFRDDLEIIMDLCLQDLEDEYYILDSIKTSGNLKLGYFRVNILTDEILKNIKLNLEVTKTEETLEKLRQNITKEISVRTKKGVSY